MNIDGSKGIFIGGASGMCRATATKFHAKGGSVSILDLPSSDGAAVAKELGGTFFPCNVTDYAAADQAIADATEALGGLHFVLNTAGGGNRAVGGMPQRTLMRDGSRHSTDTFAKVLELNLVGSFNVNTAAAQHMANNEPNEAGERGVMINTASIAAFEGQIGQVAYTAAKGGIAAMTLTMARDLGALGIRLSLIHI